MAHLELTVQGNEPQSVAVEKATKKPKKELDDARRDEWSNEAINSLLDVYEEKWNYRNRGNLKGGDWEDVSLRVSARNGGLRTPKTPFQCKNKVASMKQKYRSEALLKGISGSGCSRWPFFVRMDTMLKVPLREDEGIPPDEMNGAVAAIDPRLQEALLRVESGDSQQEFMGAQEPFHVAFLHGKLEAKKEAVGQNRDNNQEDASNTLPSRKLSGAQESDSSIPRSKAAQARVPSGKPVSNHRKHLDREVAASIQSFAASILKLEEAKLEMLKDSERLRAELEARRVDMELKRTEIIMKTQLQIARLLSKNPGKRKAGFKKSDRMPVITSTNVRLPLQNTIQADPLMAIHRSVMQVPCPTNAAQPIHTGNSMSNLAPPLQYPVHSEPC